MAASADTGWREHRVLVRVGLTLAVWVALRLIWPGSLLPAVIGLAVWALTFPRLRRLAGDHLIVTGLILVLVWWPLARWVADTLEPRLLGWTWWTGPGLDVVPPVVRDWVAGAVGAGLLIWACTRRGLWRFLARSGRGAGSRR